jgi:hypothetical protein
MVHQSGSAADRYPLLRDEVEAADQLLSSAYEDADERALDYQRKFRRSELAVIWGGVIAMSLGVVAGVTGAGVLSFAETILASFLGTVAFVAGSLKWQGRWLRYRWQAESLRGERFSLIGRLGAYAGDVDRNQVTRLRMVEIEDQVRGEGTHE